MLLQHIATRMSCNLGLNLTLDFSPKCNPEIAGEGIEYVWVSSKNYLRGVPLGKRRNVKQFKD
eukprot:11485357-Ditylum_brightwellii.AAC.2